MDNPRSRTLAKLLLLSCTAGLVGAVLTLAAMQAVKYSRDLTTITERAEKEPFLDYPVVSFCPGFKTQNRLSSVWMQRQSSVIDLGSERPDAREGFPGDAAALRSVWEETTFALEEILTSVTLASGGNTRHSFHPGAGGNGDGNRRQCVDVTEHATLSGRCYSLTLPCSTEEFIETAVLLFNLSSMAKGRLFLYIHGEVIDASVGLNVNFWILPAAREEAFVNEVKEIGMKKKLRIKREGLLPDEYYVCLRKFASRYLGNLNNSLCVVPMFGALLSFSGMDTATLDPCTNYEGYNSSYGAMYKLLNGMYWGHCRRPSHKVSYTTTKQELLLPIQISNGMSEVHLFYNSKSVAVSEEYKLIDLGSLLSSLGGFIGMFLGWSLLDIVRLLTHILDGTKKYL